MESTQLPPPPQKERPRLERLRSDRAVAGVASGLARYLDIDVAWVRIAFVVAALFGGTGVLMYVIGWIAMPEEGERDSIATDKARNMSDAGSWIGIGLIVIAAMIIVGNTGIIDGDLILAGVLIALGFLLYRGDLGNFANRQDRSDDVVGQDSPAAPENAPASSQLVSADPVIYGREGEEPPPAPPVVPPPLVPPPAPDPAFQPRTSTPRQSSALGRLAMATVLIAVGIMGVGQSAGWWEPGIRHYVGAVFVVLGAALVVGAIFGRARWLIVVGLIAAPMLFGAALLDVPLEGGFGDPHFTPMTTAELESEYRLVAGELVVDLSEIQVAPQDVLEIEASVVFGSLQIRVPQGAGVEISGEIDAGEIRYFGDSVAQGVNHDRSVVLDGAGLIVIDAHVGFGELVVTEVEETP